MSWRIALLYTPAPTGRAKALLLCGDCGLSADDVDDFIDNVRWLGNANKSRELWEETYTDPAELEEARKLCLPCVEAIIEEAGR